MLMIIMVEKHNLRCIEPYKRTMPKRGREDGLLLFDSIFLAQRSLPSYIPNLPSEVHVYSAPKLMYQEWMIIVATFG